MQWRNWFVVSGLVSLLVLTSGVARASEVSSAGFFFETITEVDDKIESGGLRAALSSESGATNIHLGIGLLDVTLLETKAIGPDGEEEYDGFVAIPIFFGLSTRGTFALYGEFGVDLLELVFKGCDSEDEDCESETGNSDGPDPYLSLGARLRAFKHLQLSVYNKWYYYDGNHPTTKGQIVGFHLGLFF